MTPVLSPSVDYTLADQQRMQRAQRYFAWQSELVRRQLGRRVVEVGCGVGNFTRQILDREMVIGLDVEAACVAELLARYPSQANLQAYTMDVTDARFRSLARYQPDTVVCLNVLEHVRDHGLAMFNMASILPEGGRIILLVPAFASLYGPIDRKLGHWRRYSKDMIRQLARESSLGLRLLHFMNTVGFFGWWFNAHVLKRTAQSEAQIALFDSAIVPVIRRIEALVRPPFGQNLFAVFEKALP